MLHIKLANYRVDRESKSPHVYFTSLAGVVPGSSYDVTRLTPNCDSFFLLLTGVYTPKGATRPSCLLADNSRENSAYWAALTKMIESPRPANARANTSAILKFLVYEATSTAEPSRMTADGGVSNSSKPLGESEAYAAGVEAGSAGVSSESIAVKEMGLDTLTEVRVGEAVVSIDSLVRLYLEHKDHKAAAAATSPVEVELKIQEFGRGENGGPVTRGALRLAITFHPQLSISPSSDATTDPSPMDASHEVDVVSFETPEILDFLARLAKGHSTSLLSAEEVRFRNARVAKDLKQAFMKDFFAQFVIGGAAGEDADSLPPPSNLRDRLRSRPARLTAYQAPLMSIDGESSVLSGSYYYQPIKRDFITAPFTEKLLGDLFDAVCIHLGTSSEAVAHSIHSGLSVRSPSDLPTIATGSLLASLRIVGYFLGLTPAGFRYREDYILATGGTEADGFADRVEDTSRSLFLGLNGEDCDGFDAFVAAIIYILFMGLPQPRKPYLTKDPLAMAMIKYLCKCGDHSNPHCCVGSWNHPGLQACQRLLFHYTPVSIVGACVNEYPKELRPDSLESDREDYRVNLPTLTNLPSLAADPVLFKELKKLFTPTTAFSDMMGHRWSIAVPTAHLVAALARGFKREEEDGVRARQEAHNSYDSSFGRSIQLLFKSLQEYPMAVQPSLPVLLLEASKPTNVYSICGASAWVEDEGDKRKVAEMEARSRDLAMRTSNSAEGMFFDVDVWEPRGVVMASEGVAKFVVGDDNPAALPAGFQAGERRYSTFYKSIVSGDLPTFVNLTRRQDIEICFVGDNDNYVGRDIENVFGLRPDSGYDLICPLLRIDPEIRNKLAHFEEEQRRERIPSQLGTYSSENIQSPVQWELKTMEEGGNELPTDLEADSAGTSSSSVLEVQNDWTNVFRRTFLTVNMNIISKEHLDELETLIKQKAGGIRCSEFRLHPRAAQMRIYSFYVK